MCTYEDLVAATLPYGLSPLVVPQLQDDHPRRRGHRARHRVDVVPQRAAARVGAGDGHPDRHRRGGHRQPRAARRPVPRLPEFLWHARLFGSAADRAGAGQAVRRAAAHLRSTRWPSWSRRWTASSTPAATTGERVDYLDGVVFSADESYLCLGVQTATPGPVSDYTGQDIYYRSIQHDRRRQGRPADHPRLPVALGHRLVLVLAGVRRAEPDAAPVLAAALPAQQLLLEADRLRPAVQHRRPHRSAQRPAAAANASSRTSRCRSNGPREFLSLVPGQRPDRADLAVPAAARATTARPGRCTRCGPATPTSTSASGPRCRSGPTAEGYTNRLIEAQGQRARRTQVAVFRRLLLARGV